MNNKKVVWTYLYSPFRLGAPNGCNIPTGTEISDYKKINLGKGFKGILFTNTSTGNWHIAEEVSGAIVGTKDTEDEVVKMVEDDIKLAKDIKQMKNQVNNAIKVVDEYGIEMIPIDKFFKGFK